LGYYHEISNSPLKDARSLKQIREDAEMTQKQVCEQLGVTTSQYSQWETGVAAIPDKHKDNLAKILQLDPSNLK
jgi:transcriptional regulator with XRE-family HTH domain